MSIPSPWRVEKIPILDSNFVFVIRKAADCLIVDPGEAGPVLDHLEKHSLKPHGILITHHHGDHVGGIGGILEKYKIPVYGPVHENIPHRTVDLMDGQSIQPLGLRMEILELPGHTLGHIAYWLPETKWLFSGDVLFALGCGRLFEGTPQQMFDSLSRLKQLPSETLIFCTHDYYEDNAAFCRQEGFVIAEYDSIHPLMLGQEKTYNPFLTAGTTDDFRRRREKRNAFKRENRND